MKCKLNIIVLFFNLAIEAEKGQQQLISGIENFDPAKLKHTITEEKNPLPTKEGKLIKCNYKFYFKHFMENHSTI